MLRPITNHQSPITNRQSPIANYQLPITNCQLPITNQQSPIANYTKSAFETPFLLWRGGSRSYTNKVRLRGLDYKGGG